MGHPQIKVDNSLLDNGSWRETVGALVVQSDDLGKSRTLSVEFTIQGDTAAEIRTRWLDTVDSFYLANPRIQAWFDDEASPVEDWIPGAPQIYESACTVSMLPEESQTGNKLHCVFVAIAVTQADISRSSRPATDDTVGPAAGLLTELDVVKMFFDSRRYTLSVSGMFGSTFDEDARGPFTISGISDNGGKVRFTLSGSPSLGAFEAGLRLTVSGTGNFAGVHLVTAINDTTDVIDTETTYATPSGTHTTLLIGETTSALENYEAARPNILTKLLETGTNGTPGATAPFMVLAGENFGFPSERLDNLEFSLTSVPSAMRLSINDDDSQTIERGLSYAVSFRRPDMWMTEIGPAPIEVLVDGKFSITEQARGDRSMKLWWDEAKEAILTQVAIENGNALGADAIVQSEQVSIDYATNDVSFNLTLTGNYTGTLAYTKTTTFSDKKAFTIIEDTEGYDHVQFTNAPARRIATVSVSWTGDGSGPVIPATPTEGGYQYIFDSSVTARKENQELPDGTIIKSIDREYTFVRTRPRSGSSGSSGGSDSGSFGGGN